MDYIKILRDGKTLYGGNQSCLDGKTLQGYGCGLIAAADVSLFLSKVSNTLKWEQYEKYLRRIQKYFLVIPSFGMNGWSLSFGINLIFLRNKMPYFAHWKMMPLGSRTKKRMQTMLDRGIPVIIAAGPNFPNVFGKKSLPIYKEKADGSLYKAGSIHRHFVVVTSMNENDMIISSWGQKYHIKWDEYVNFARKDSIFFFTNYLEIKEKNKNNNFTI